MYRVSYEADATAAADLRDDVKTQRTEYFKTVTEALNRARQLLEARGCHMVILENGSVRCPENIRPELASEVPAEVPAAVPATDPQSQRPLRRLVSSAAALASLEER
jgi:hypothetical protein